MNLENIVKKASGILKDHNIYSHELDAEIILSNIMKVTRTTHGENSDDDQKASFLE